MDWYQKLSEYFPIEEMKSREHMERLLREKGDIYHKDEGKYHVLMYAEFPTFVFIDYIWVSPKSRGKGIGNQLMEKLKTKNKPIILEVEPIDYDDSDTEKRLRFYKKEEFKHENQSDIIVDPLLQMKKIKWKFSIGHLKMKTRMLFLNK